MPNFCGPIFSARTSARARYAHAQRWWCEPVSSSPSPPRPATFRVGQGARREGALAGPYRRPSDLGAGLARGVAYAGIAGLPPLSGLLGALAGLTVYGFLGGSRFATVSATSSSAAVLAAALHTMTNVRGVQAIELAASIVMMAGVLFLAVQRAAVGAARAIHCTARGARIFPRYRGGDHRKAAGQVVRAARCKHFPGPAPDGVVCKTPAMAHGEFAAGCYLPGDAGLAAAVAENSGHSAGTGAHCHLSSLARCLRRGNRIGWPDRTEPCSCANAGAGYRTVGPRGGSSPWP